MTTHDAIVPVEMFLDVSCPWCHGGLETNRRVLDEIAADAAMPTLDVQWRFMRLHPMPEPGGIPLDDYYAQWPGGAHAAQKQVNDYAHSVGVVVDFSRYDFLHDPQTAHRLLAIVRDDAGHDLPSLWSLARAVWSANFVHGVNIADHAALRGAVERFGLWLPERIWQTLADPDGHLAQTLADHERALEIELDGVPRMYVGGKIIPTWVDPQEVRDTVHAAILDAAG